MFRRFTNAINGRFFSKATADRHPDTAVGSQVYHRPRTYDDVVLELVNAASMVESTRGYIETDGRVSVNERDLSRLRRALAPFRSPE